MSDKDKGEYERYQLRWLDEHGISLRELLDAYAECLEHALTEVALYQRIRPGQIARMLHVDGDPVAQAAYELEHYRRVGGEMWLTRDEWEARRRAQGEEPSPGDLMDAAQRGATPTPPHRAQTVRHGD